MSNTAVSLKLLDIMLYMNKHKLCRLKDIHEALEYPKATILRFLDLLIEQGFIQRHTGTPFYSITSGCTELSAGVTPELRFIETAAPLCDSLTEKLNWPIAISTFEGDHMMIRYSTRPQTKYTFIKSTVGQHFPMFGSAIGELWLAHCPKNTQRRLLKSFTGKEIAHRLKRLTMPDTATYLAQVSRQDYAVRNGNKRESSSLAVPVYLKKRPIGLVSLSAFSQTVGHQFVAAYLKELRELSQSITEKLS